MAKRKVTKEVTVCDICSNTIDIPIYHTCLVCRRTVCDSHTGCGSFWRDFAGYYFGKHHRVCIDCFKQPKVQAITDRVERVCKRANISERKHLEQIKPTWLKKTKKGVKPNSSQD